MRYVAIICVLCAAACGSRFDTDSLFDPIPADSVDASSDVNILFFQGLPDAARVPEASIDLPSCGGE